MKEKYKLLRKKITLLALTSTVFLTGCSKTKNENNKEKFNEHYHYIIGYGDKNFIIRECESNDEIELNNGVIYVSDSGIFSSYISSGSYTAVRIENEEDEEYYRSIENEQIENGSVMILKK